MGLVIPAWACRQMSEGAFSSLAQVSAPFRRLGGSLLARYFVLAAGLIAMMFLTMPELRIAASVWLNLILWLCLAYFAVETAMHLANATRNNALRGYLLSLSGFVDLLGIFPVPIALAAGAAPERRGCLLRYGCSSWRRTRRASPRSGGFS